MDQKRLLLKGQSRRYSPRLKSGSKTQTPCSSATGQDETILEVTQKVPTPNISPKCLETDQSNPEIKGNIQNVTPSTPNIPKVTEPRTPDRKPCETRLSTPSSNSVQRELKKIEDYWTRQDPIKTDSPRLRRHKNKGSRNDEMLNENTTTPRIPDETQTTAVLHEAESLPESPFPNRTKTDDSEIGGANKDFIKEIVIHPFRQNNEELTENTDDHQHLVSSGNDDEGYMPPRKKLRSEVKQDELWEGIPLTVSFKRLTPLCKRNDNQIQSKASDTIADIIEGREGSRDEQENAAKCVPEFNLCLTPNTEVQKSPVCDDTIKEKKEVDNEGLVQLIATYPKQDTVAILSSPKVKRSARLQQKNTKTPNKLIEKSNKSVDEPFSPSYSNKEKINASLNSHNPSVSKDDGKTEEIPQKCIGDQKIKDIEILNEEENIRDLVGTGKEDEYKAYETNDITGMSISQILSCDSQTSLYVDDVPDVANTVEVELDSTVLYDKDESIINIDNESVSTLEELNNDIIPGINRFTGNGYTDGPCLTSGSKEKGEAAPTTNTSTDKQIYSEITKAMNSTKKQKPRKSKVESNSKGSTVKTDIDKTSEFTEKIEKQNKKGQPLFTLIKETKSGKSKKVPPLKIKLKNTNISKRRKCWRVNTNNEKESCEETTSVETETKSSELDEEIASTSEQPTNGKKQMKSKTGCKKNKTNTQVEVTTPSCSKSKSRKRSGSTKEFKKWSPPSNVNLRLNSERRLSMVNGLLSNKVLNNHACVIWSSENRRHMQLSHPNSTASELDELLREKWAILGEKEKVRYFQRAWDASKDENKHSNRRHETFEVTEKQSSNPSIERFLSMDSKSQHTEIKQWLQFYSEVSHGAYTNVIDQFRASLQAENQEDDQADKKSKSKTRTKKNKSKKQKQKVCENDTNAKHRRLMFEAILRNRQDILETWAEKKETQAQVLRENFDGLVRKLVAGDSVDLTHTITSTRLTDVLHDLRDLEKDKMLMVSGEDTNVSSYTTLLNEVDEYLKEKKKPSSFLDSLGNECVDHDKVEEYLRVTNKLDEHKMPILNAVAIKHVLDDVKHQSKRHNNLSIYKKHVTLSPPSMLTEWVAEDVVRVNPNVGYRSALSLLSNKVHPSPAFVAPTSADHVSVSSAAQRKMQSLLMANSNQNCYKTVTYTFTRDRNTNPIISKLKRCSQGYNIRREKTVNKMGSIEID